MINQSNFVLKYFKKYMKMPKLRDGEIPQEESKERMIDTSQRNLMKEFVVNCLKTS